MSRARGIDVSEYQGNIDWQAVKSSGIEFAVIRATIGTRVDKKFKKNIEGAKAVGLAVGVYYYVKARMLSQIDKECDKLFKALKGYDIDLPVFVDMEDASMLSDSSETHTQLMLRALKNITAEGYTAGIYSNPDWLVYRLDYKRLENYPLWLACWTSEKRVENVWNKPYDYWQYGLTNVKGVTGDVDGDVAIVELPYHDKPKTYTVTVTNCVAAWIRSAPHVSTSTITCAIKGQKLQTVGQKVTMGGVEWLKVNVSKERVGWIAMRYIKE